MFASIVVTTDVRVGDHMGAKMKTATISSNKKQGLLAGVLSFAICMTAGLLPASPTQALPGEVFTNGTIPNAANKQPGPIPSNLVGFLFEPEVPFASLKSVPTWNELEQLLDNPYLVTLDTVTPGNAQGYPSYRATGVTRRPGFGVTLPPLLVDPLNYNPTTGEEMRLLNPDYTGGRFSIPDELIQCSGPEGLTVPGCDGTRTIANAVGALVTTGPFDPSRYVWRFKTVDVTPGAGRVLPGQAEISYNAPFAKDLGVGTALPTCIVTAETVPPEGATMCGGDPGEPGYVGLGQPLFPIGAAHRAAYSTPAVPGVMSAGQTATGLLYDPGRRAPEAFAGFILPRDAQGRFGLRKPSLRVATAGGRTNNPNFLVNRTDTGAVAADPAALTPSNENDYVRNRNVAIALGKSLFWDMQVGSDGVQSCGTCHFNGTGTDTRTKNQVNPNHLGGDLTFTLKPPNGTLVAADFPLHKLINHEVAGDPACTTPLLASVNAGVLENNFPLGVTDLEVCNAANVLSDTNDVVSSMGVVFSPFTDIAPVGALSNALAFQPAVNGVRAVMPDVRTAGALDPIPGFQGLRRVEPRNTPTMQAAAFNFDNFWDGRARHDFNGGGVFGAADPQSHVFVGTAATGALVPTRQLIRFASIASLATGPGLSEFEMSFAGRNWSKVGKKLLQAGVTPLANQLVDPTDSALGPYSNQNVGSAACAALTGDNRSGSWGTNAAGKPGLCISYRGLIRQAYYPALWQNTGQHLNGCYTNSDPLDPRTPKCGSVGVIPSIPVLSAGTVVSGTADPFDGYVLTIASGTATPTNTNQFTHMEGNFSLFWGLSVNLWVGVLVPDNTPFDQVLEANAGAFETLGEPGERGLVNDQLTCGLPDADPNYCFTELGNFKRDSDAMATQGVTGEGGVGGHLVSSPGTRTPGSNQPDPLLGLDLFFASNLSLKNPNFRTGRCGECHAVPTLTDHTMPFTFKAQLRDFIKEFVTGQPGVETLVEPLGRLRVISGFLLESEMNENGQDGVERRIANQSIVPCPIDGLAYPGGLEGGGPGQGFGTCAGAAASFFDNGIYNLGVRPISDDLGRGGDDAFGWPLSLSALMLKNLAGPAFEPGVPLPNFDPGAGFTGGLFEESSQDQQINPGVGGDPINSSMLPAYLGPFTNQINVGDSAPELDEVFGGVNTLTDIGMLEGFLDTLGPFNTAGVLNESLNMGDTTLMGTWPNANRVGRMGSFKAPQLRNVELTGPYFHNGGKLTLRQVVDFYSRGGDFPMTNAAHRDFNIINQNIEVQSNLSEAEKVAMVDFLLELTDDRNRFDRAPFDHPEVIVPVDGAAPDNTLGRTALLSNPMFMDVAAVGAAGQVTPEPAFLNVTKVRVSSTDAEPGSTACNYTSGVVSHYCH